MSHAARRESARQRGELFLGWQRAGLSNRDIAGATGLSVKRVNQVVLAAYRRKARSA